MRTACKTSHGTVAKMEINRKTRIQIRLQNIVFVLLFLVTIGLLAWLSQRYEVEYDWTATGRNTLSDTSIAVLQRIPGPVDIVAFARESQSSAVRRNIRELIKRYQKHKPDIKLRFIDPDTQPDKVRDLDITIDGEMIIDYQGRSEHVTVLKEETITNTLQRLLRSSEKHILYVDGHGERAPHGQANFDYQMFSDQLADKGIKSSRINLVEQTVIPEDTAVLVIASTRIDYLDGEVAIIRDYVKKGGNLLWLQEPGDELYNLDSLAADLHIRFVPGVIVDPTTQLLGLDDPTFALIARYGNHPITRDFSFMTLFPRATAVEFTGKEDDNGGWQAEPFLITVERSWSETGPLQGVIEYQPDSDTLGPLDLGLALSRTVSGHNGETDQEKPADTPQKKQRIIILGDGDFLSNTYLGNQGNQNMGYNIINWLSHDDNFISIPEMKAIDVELNLSESRWAWLGMFFLVGIPLALLASGIIIWLKRRKR